MSEEQPTLLSGTIIRGADGTLYFIADEDAGPFRVLEGSIDKITAVLEQHQRGEDPPDFVVGRDPPELVTADALHVVLQAHAVFGCQHHCRPHPVEHDDDKDSGTEEAIEYGADEE